MVKRKMYISPRMVIYYCKTNICSVSEVTSSVQTRGQGVTVETNTNWDANSDLGEMGGDATPTMSTTTTN